MAAMTTTKAYFSTMAALILASTVSACGSNDEPSATVITTTATVTIQPPPEQSSLGSSAAPLAAQGLSGLANAPSDPNSGEDAESQFAIFIFNEVAQFWSQTEGVDLQTTPVTFQMVYAANPTVSCVLSDKQTVATGDVKDIGPFYCQDNGQGQKVIYWPTANAFQFSDGTTIPSYGGFAEADAIAHEFGHYIQDLNGIVQTVQASADQATAQGDDMTAAAWTQGEELQADCMAGDWVRSQWDQGLLSDDDLTAAANVTQEVGDDVVNPGSEYFPKQGAHGTAELRLKWLNFGISDGVPADCNTWNEPVEGIYSQDGS
jgi:predicted metalloprotease